MSELFNKEDIFTPVNAEEARWYIGKKGYFASNLSELKKNINSDSYILSDILDENTLARFMYVDNGTNMVFELFLPADKVKQPEPKKWRPFKNIDEFCTCTHKKLNSEITYRNKMTNDTFHAIITRITVSNNAIDIGAHTYSLYNLFKYYELYNDWAPDHFKWQPFGVEE